MMECKVGDKVRVVANETGHRFAIGEVVRKIGEGKFEHLDGSDRWLMNKGDYESVSENTANLNIDITPATTAMNEFADACERAVAALEKLNALLNK